MALEIVIKKIILFLALGITFFGNNFLTLYVISETLDREKKEQLLAGHENIFDEIRLKARELEDSSDWVNAEKLRIQILSLIKQRYGLNHPDTAQSLVDLALVYQELFEYKKAESLYKQSLDIYKRFFDSDTPFTATSLNNLATLYTELGEYKKAEPLYIKALEINKKFFGLNHLNTSKSLNNLAYLYRKLGKYEKAEPLHIESLEISKNVLGLNHPYTATSLINLGLLYLELGEYEKAEPLYIEALEINKKFLGLNHLNTSKSLNNLGFLYLEMGEYEKAEPLYKQALEIRKNLLGLNHPDTATSLSNLSSLYHELGMYEKAEPLYIEALEINKKFFGLNHPATAKSLNNLAVLYEYLGEYEKAEPLHIESLEIRKNVLGLNHHATATSLINLGRLYTGVGEYEKAEPLYIEGLEINKKVFGLNHPNTSKSLNHLGTLYGYLGEYKKAAPLYKQALEIRKNVLGLNHPYTAISLSNLSILYHKLGMYEKAEPLYIEALEINKKVLGLNHPNTVIVLNNLGLLYEDLGEYKKSNKFLKDSVISNLNFIKRVVPFLSLSNRIKFTDNYGFNDKIFINLDKNIRNKELALFSQINTKGLLEEIEKKQSQLKFLPGPQKEIADQLKIINQYIANSNNDQNKIQDLIRDRESLEKELYRVMPKLKTRIVNIEELIKVMPSDSILIEYVRYYPYVNGGWNSPRYMALVLDPSKNDFKNGDSSKYKIHTIDLGLAETLENKIKKALIATEEGLSESELLLKDIGKNIIKPIAAVSKESKTWFITPDGELNKIPFAALGGYQGNNLLVDRIKIKLLTTGRELIDLVEKSKSNSEISYVFANPLFDTNRTRISDKTQNKTLFELDDLQNRSIDLVTSGWSPLPGTAKEGKFIANIINANLIVGDKATAKKIINLKSPDILHIASHSFYLKNKEDNINPQNNSLITQNSKPLKYFAKNENPLLRSGVVLAGANNPNLNQEDDGYLTALEISQLDWEGTDLVVISGCESGLGDIKNGDGIYGLKRAISVAGAKSSLLSLWKVDDQATAVFMKSFYERLIVGEDKSDALINTQREFRNHINKNYRHPSIWAAFQLNGDWKPIIFKK
tara:strand:- start:3052 stop:6336 length:3285 start_codon:yes stop_codon:yes gene_type:complete